MKRIYGIVGICFLLSCKREKIVYPVEPYIEFRSVSPREIVDLGAPQIEIYYRDGDGDLGGLSEEAAKPDLILHDLRDSTLFPSGYDGKLYYNLPRLIKENRPISIQGTIQIMLPEVARLNSAAPKETLAFRIYVIDRAGHQSNQIITDPIIITGP